MAHSRQFQLLPYTGQGFYSRVSRAVDRSRVFSAEERGTFRKIMRQTERFCGVQVVTWAMLPNHFRILVEIPEQEELDEARETGARAMRGGGWDGLHTVRQLPNAISLPEEGSWQPAALPDAARNRLACAAATPPYCVGDSFNDLNLRSSLCGRIRFSLRRQPAVLVACQWRPRRAWVRTACERRGR